MYIPRRKILTEKYSRKTSGEEEFIEIIENYELFKFQQDIITENILDSLGLYQQSKHLNVLMGKCGTSNYTIHNKYLIDRKKQIILFEINSLHKMVTCNTLIFSIFQIPDGSMIEKSNKYKDTMFFFSNYVALFKKCLKIDISGYVLSLVVHKENSEWDKLTNKIFNNFPKHLQGGENMSFESSVTIQMKKNRYKNLNN